MTRRLEEELGLPHLDEFEDTSYDIEPHETESATLMDSLSTAEKLDLALSTVTGIDKHDTEMDDIAKRAITSYDELITLGKNVPAAASGRIYEVAGQMLKHALDARNSKTDKKLKLIELQLKKLKLEQDSGEGERSHGDELDRNELLSLIRSSNKVANSNSDDK